MEKSTKTQKIYQGEVLSDKMNKTIVVKTLRTYEHPQFSKILRKEKKYQVHDENELASVGDIVEFTEGRPRSKNKYMYLSRVVTSASATK